jgi:glycosyltransferase involved in cell wall biosynthesis
MSLIYEKTKSYTHVPAVESLHVSVVIPTFNRIERLERALQSVLAQTYRVSEIIVVDDGSSDGTQAMIQDRFGDQVRYFYQGNRGVSCARNSGIRRSTGDWIAFLDSDDEWLPEKLQTQINALKNNPDHGLCHTNEIWIRKGKRVNPMIKHDKSGGYIYRRCLPLCVISPSSVLMHRDVFDEIGLFDESLPACEDYDYWLRYCARYPVLYIESHQLIKHGGHEDQLSQRYWGMDRFRVQALLKMLQSAQLSETDRVATIETIEEKCRILQAGANKHRNHEVMEFCQQALVEVDSLKNSNARHSMGKQRLPSQVYRGAR